MTLTPAEIEGLRIAIAEEMGWTKSNYDSWISVSGHYVKDTPPYTTSIDAIRMAAMERFKEEKQASEFRQELGYVACSEHPFQWTWQLTALDWSVAFARTAKIWRYKV